MLYKFITDKDLDQGMKDYFRQQVMGTPDKLYILKTSEAAAFSYIKGELGNRYDMAQLFPPLFSWDNTTAFTTGQYACKNDVFYKALLDGTNQDPETATTYWKQEDPRDQLLVVHAVAITLYYFLDSADQRKITDKISNNYAAALDWLQDVKEGIKNPDFPLLDDGSSTIRWGANPKQTHYY